VLSTGNIWQQGGKTMHLTQKETLEQLEASGRTGWTLRLMTTLREQGFLPPLSTKKPRNTWSEEDLEQVVAVYDCWEECAGNRVTLTLMLWLQGYKVPLDRFRDFYKSTIEAYLQQLTHGKTDQEAILDEVSRTMLAFSDKLKHTPDLAAQRKKIDIKQMEGVTEAFLDAIAVTDPERATEFLYSLLSDAEGALEKMAKDEAFFEEELGEQPQHIAAILHDTLTLPHLREVIQTATPEQWGQAREDYLCFCQLFGELGGILTNYGAPVPELPERFLANWMIIGAIWLTAPFLSARCRGYGQELDLVFKAIHGFLTNVEVNERLAALAAKRKLFPSLPAKQAGVEEPIQ